MLAHMAISAVALADLVGPFGRTLSADGKAPATIRRYVGTVAMVIDYLPDAIAAADITRHHMRDWMADLRDQGRADNSLATYFGSMQQFWRWALEDEYVDNNPMDGLKAPRIAEKQLPLLTDGDIAALLKVTEGRDFASRRDHALIRVLVDTGIRRGELVGLTLSDLDLPDGRRGATAWGTLLIRSGVSKSDRDRAVPLGNKTMRSLDRYLPLRAGHPPAAFTDRLFLSQRGPLHPNGCGDLIRRIGKRAGVEGLHPHRFRHTFAHRFLLEGGNEHDLMQIAGWRAPQMVARYGAAGRQERAFASFKSLGDKF
jgi:site-specific recombinase XerD